MLAIVFLLLLATAPSGDLPTAPPRPYVGLSWLPVASDDLIEAFRRDRERRPEFYRRDAEYKGLWLQEHLQKWHGGAK